MSKKMRPADCKDWVDASKLEEQGIELNGDSISIDPLVVVLNIGSTTVRIPMSKFKTFAEWYLTEQDING